MIFSIPSFGFKVTKEQAGSRSYHKKKMNPTDKMTT